MKLHTVFITHNRLDLTKQSVESYLATVTLPHTYVIVDNASTDGTREWIQEFIRIEKLRGEPGDYHLLPENKYPGYAANRGWEYALGDVTHLHRADNDMAFIPGWCDQVEDAFRSNRIGQLGLRTDAEEFNAPMNVGGNCVILRTLFDRGLRYDETPWPEHRPGMSEDSYFSPAVRKMGYRWTRVTKPCLISLATGDWDDPYYAASYGDRKIVRGTLHTDKQRRQRGIR